MRDQVCRFTNKDLFITHSLLDELDELLPWGVTSATPPCECEERISSRRARDALPPHPPPSHLRRRPVRVIRPERSRLQGHEGRLVHQVVRGRQIRQNNLPVVQVPCVPEVRWLGAAVRIRAAAAAAREEEGQGLAAAAAI